MKARESGMPDESMWAGFFNPTGALAELALTQTSGDVLDFGCGYGTFALPAAAIISPSIVHAIDIDTEMVRRVMEKAEVQGSSNLRVVQRDFIATGSGLPDGSIGYVTLFNILHAENPMVLLNESRRVLTENGVLAIMHWKYDSKTPRGPSMNIRPKPAQCRTWAFRAGFAQFGAELIDLPPYHYGMTFRTS